MEKLRATYAQYGLGVSTGIRPSGRVKGYTPEHYDPSNVLTESFGQFDNYTAMQLATICCSCRKWWQTSLLPIWLKVSMIIIKTGGFRKSCSIY